MDYLIGLDIGTSSVKGVLMSTVKAEATYTSNMQHKYYIEDGLKVLDAEEFCNTCFALIKDLTSKLNEQDKVLALCCSGASGNLMFVKEGKSISPVFGWQNEIDNKITDKYLINFNEENIYTTVGWHKNNSFPLAVMAYIKENKPQLITDADKICMHIEYLNFKMTGQWGITPSMGTPFYFINQVTGQYEHNYINIFGIKEGKMPPVMENYTILGQINSFASEKTGLDVGTSVVLGTFDHPSAARGAGVLEENQVLLSCGTSWVVLIPYANRSIPMSQNMLVDRFMFPNGNWCGMASLTSISDKIKKYINHYIGDIGYKEFDKLAQDSVCGANGLVIDGLNCKTENYNKSDIARAIMESIANELNETLKRLNLSSDTEIAIVGGITNSDIWIKVISEITGKKVYVKNAESAGAVGAAIMAGIGIGALKSEYDVIRER